MKSKCSQVRENGLFLGIKYNFRKYFDFINSINSGTVNDYALWVVSTAAVVIVYVFLLVP